jgi:hypothetical protein
MGHVSSPHRDESDTLQQRVLVLQRQNMELEAALRARKPLWDKNSKARILLLVLLCLVAPLPAGCVGCATGLANPAGPCPT